MQEPASVAFSLLNLAFHARGAQRVRHAVPEDHPMRWYYLAFAIFNINAWIWSAAFHTRGMDSMSSQPTYVAHALNRFAHDREAGLLLCSCGGYLRAVLHRHPNVPPLHGKKPSLFRSMAPEDPEASRHLGLYVRRCFRRTRIVPHITSSVRLCVQYGLQSSDRDSA